MEALTILFVIVISLVGLDLAAYFWGTDSREPIGDDHAR
jgi:cbb3-type cytochrome oxidase maturation protein